MQSEKKGEWIEVEWYSPLTRCSKCSKCGYRYKYDAVDETVSKNFCPNCGANMMNNADGGVGDLASE